MKTRMAIGICVPTAALAAAMLAVRAETSTSVRPAESPLPIAVRSSSPPAARALAALAQPVPASAPVATDVPADDGAARRAAIMAQFDATALRVRWEGESEDAHWASRLEGDVQRVFADGARPGLELIAVECRATLCRIEVGFDSNDAFRALVPIFTERAPLSSLQGRSDVDGDRLIAYLGPAKAEPAN